MAVVVINGESLPFAEKLVEKFKAVIGDNLKSLMININKKDTNVILGDENRLVYGRDYITDILLGKRFRLSPNSFYQVNSPTAELLYLKAKEYADLKGNTLLDLYCGAGTIGLTIGTQAERIIGVEIVEDAVKDAEFNAQNNGITNAEFICADALKASEKLREKKIKADTVIVDPPRKGCSGELLSIIANDFSPERVVYISCDVSTLARDIKILTEMGYELREYTPVDMFPRTPHVETVALLSRQKGQKVL
jgi:23S rRNA (uracil1939-C5)-methyltransferase